MRTAILLVLMATTSMMMGVAQPADNLTLARNYLKAYEELDFDKMGTFYHDSIVFEDLIYEEVYKQPGRVEGKDNVVNTWKSAFQHKPEYIRITVREAFASGSYVVLDQIFENMTRAGEKTSLIKGQMLTVLKFKAGKIIEQKDFAEYSAFNRQMLFQSRNEKITIPINPNIAIALDYMKAYTAWDIDQMSTHYDASVHFTDFIAVEAFKGSTFDHVGKENVTAFWKGIFENKKPEFVNVTVQNVYATSSFVVLHTLFELVLPDAWTPKSTDRVFVSFPIKTVLQFKDGKIISQQDFANYAQYNKQIGLQTKASTN